MVSGRVRWESPFAIPHELEENGVGNAVPWSKEATKLPGAQVDCSSLFTVGAAAGSPWEGGSGPKRTPPSKPQ